MVWFRYMDLFGSVANGVRCLVWFGPIQLVYGLGLVQVEILNDCLENQRTRIFQPLDEDPMTVRHLQPPAKSIEHAWSS